MHLLSIALLALTFTAYFFLSLFFGRSVIGRFVSAALLMIGTFAGLWILPASAAEPSTSVHLDPTLISDLGTFVGAVILAIGAVAWKWIEQHSPLAKSQIGDVARQAAMGLLDKAAQFGATQTESALTKVGDVDVGNAAVASGANFAIAHGADLLKAVGFDIETPEGQAAIIRSVTLRLGTILDPKSGPVPTPIKLPTTITVAGTPTSARA